MFYHFHLPVELVIVTSAACSVIVFNTPTLTLAVACSPDGTTDVTVPKTLVDCRV